MGRRSTLALLGVILGFLFYSSSPDRSYAQSGSIVGQVRIAPGNEIKSPVLVTLSTRGAPVNTIYTDNEGHFGFNGLPGNLYHVEINEDGYYPVKEEVPIDPVSANMKVLTIYLLPRENKPKAPPSIGGGNMRLSNSSQYEQQLPKAARKQFERAVRFDEEGKSEEAIRHYEKAIEIAPLFYEARNNLGSDLLGKARYSEAQLQFEEVIKVNPADAASYFNLANLYILTKQAENAQLWIERGLSRQPDSALGHFLQGSLYEMTGKFKEAETSLRRSIELDPLMAKAHLALVNLYLRTKRDEQAVSELRAFLTAFPNDAFAPKAKQVLKRLEGGSAASDPLTR
jgi:tetratricopeptide (TPR) repeat protein